MMLMGFGCCEPPVLDCFGCDERLALGIPAENVSLACSGFSWSVPETSTTYENVRFTSSPASHGVTTHGFRSINISNVNGSKQLRKNPNGSCQWLWNEVIATESKFSVPFTYPTSLQETEYEPLNPTDSTNSWGRVLRTNLFLGCTPAKCYSIGWPQIAAFMDIVSDGTDYRLRLLVSFVVGRTARLTSITIGASAYPIANQTLIYNVAPVGYAIENRVPTALTPVDYSTGSGATPPFRWGAGTFGFFNLGGGLAYYESEPIECTEAFFGETITLTNTHEYDARVAFWEASVPETVEVTL